MPITKNDILEKIDGSPATSPDDRVRYRGLSLCVVMASWNEEGKVGPGVAAVPRNVVDTVCVEDNGSDDNTAKEAEQAGAIVIRHPVNLGAGGGYRTGWLYPKIKDFDIVIELAGDNQDDPNDIPTVIDTLIDGSFDYVQGSRWLEGGKTENMTLSRTLLTRIYSFLFRLFYSIRITDATNGFRAFKPEILDNDQINLWQDWLLAYELEPYLLIKTCQLGYKVGQAPVKKIYHKDMKDNTKMVPFKSWWSILRPLFYLKFGIKK